MLEKLWMQSNWIEMFNIMCENCNGKNCNNCACIETREAKIDGFEQLQNLCDIQESRLNTENNSYNKRKILMMDLKMMRNWYANFMLTVYLKQLIICRRIH